MEMKFDDQVLEYAVWEENRLEAPQYIKNLRDKHWGFDEKRLREESDKIKKKNDEMVKKVTNERLNNDNNMGQKIRQSENESKEPEMGQANFKKPENSEFPKKSMQNESFQVGIHEQNNQKAIQEESTNIYGKISEDISGNDADNNAQIQVKVSLEQSVGPAITKISSSQQ